MVGGLPERCDGIGRRNHISVGGEERCAGATATSMAVSRRGSVGCELVGGPSGQKPSQCAGGGLGACVEDFGRVGESPCVGDGSADPCEVEVAEGRLDDTGGHRTRGRSPEGKVAQPEALETETCWCFVAFGCEVGDCVEGLKGVPDRPRLGSLHRSIIVHCPEGAHATAESVWFKRTAVLLGHIARSRRLVTPDRQVCQGTS